MSNTLTPVAYVIADYYDEGVDTRHFTLAPQEPAAVSPEVSPGQFFMLAVPGYGEVPVTYGICPDQQGRFTMIVRQAGKVTRALFELPKGAVVGVRGPLGKGWPMAVLAGKNVCLVGGGCGLATLAPVVEQLAVQGVRPLLIVGAKSARSRVLKAERRRWQNIVQLIEVLMDDSDLDDAEKAGDGTVRLQGNPATELAHILRHHNPYGSPDSLPDMVLTCGPETMMAAVADKMVDYGVPAGSIYLSLERRMHCGVGSCGHCYLDDQYICTDGPTFSWAALQPITDLGEVSKPVYHHCY